MKFNDEQKAKLTQLMDLRKELVQVKTDMNKKAEELNSELCKLFGRDDKSPVSYEEIIEALL